MTKFKTVTVTGTELVNWKRGENILDVPHGVFLTPSPPKVFPLP
jgi:hypothetical protein